MNEYMKINETKLLKMTKLIENFDLKQRNFTKIDSNKIARTL